MLILLSGFMCSSKSYIGQRLANKLHFAFIDFDQYMEENILKCSISQYLNRFSEKTFRNLEAYAFRELIKQCKKADIVIAIGGEVLLDQNSQVLVKKWCNTIYLRDSPNTLIVRAAQNQEQNKGQLLKELSIDELSHKIVQLMHDREPIYEKTANYVCNTEDYSTDRLLVNHLTNYINRLRHE